MFKELRRNFAQQSATEEEAYLEIAKKLMALSDVLGQLQTCMDEQFKLKYAAAKSPAGQSDGETALRDSENVRSTDRPEEDTEE